MLSSQTDNRPPDAVEVPVSKYLFLLHWEVFLVILNTLNPYSSITCVALVLTQVSLEIYLTLSGNPREP